MRMPSLTSQVYTVPSNAAAPVHWSNSTIAESPNDTATPRIVTV